MGMRYDWADRCLRRTRLVLGLLGLVARPTAAADWPQFNFDARYSGTSLQETIIHRGNVPTLHVLYHVALPSIADGAPAFLSGVSTPLGVKDLLFLNTNVAGAGDLNKRTLPPIF